MFTEEQALAVQALKSIARDERIKSYIQRSKDLYPLLRRAAKRFVAGETREQGIGAGLELHQKGYAISLEYIGENTRTAKECIQAKNEFCDLITEAGRRSIPATISLDLSHIGLAVEPELALAHLRELAEAAKKNGLSVMISMEESQKTSQIIEVYQRLGNEYPHVGITIQAHLHRSADDLLELRKYPGRIRIVKGAYQEPREAALPRSQELTERYLSMVDTLAEANHPVSIATHDESIIREVLQRDYAKQPHVEFEMLYGVRTELLSQLKEKRCRTKVYVIYGTEWYLYLCHRLAEYPPNIFVAIADMAQPDHVERASY
ncbi:proline dehydrogenase family protein [Brevibacillus massiliensis]|uniref:proline dehydrogenase family protein n=1 Tax=Brevibacillus massiliensis TaxID=1118054 RepID=UPI000304858D|nr:proline dehydrogenase family protein [Brevibacillus massiliensis]